MLSGVAFELARKGHDVHVTTSRLMYDAPGRTLAPLETCNGVTIHRIATTRFGRYHLLGRFVDYASFFVVAAISLWRRVRRDDVLIAKTDPPLLSVMAAPIAHLRGALLVNWLQDVFPEVMLAVEPRSRWVRALARPLAMLRTWSANTAAANVAIGRVMADRLERSGVRRHLISTIPNWADETILKHRAAADAPGGLREAWGLAGKFVVGYCGNLGRAHEIDTIVGAMEELQASGDRRDIVFLFVGNGALRNTLRQRLESQGISNVVFQPYQPMELLAETLAVPDVHLVSLQPELEGLIVPSKFYGVAAAGRPTIFIGAHDGQIARDVRRFECGLQIAAGDSMALTRAVLTLAEKDDVREAMGQRARAAFERHFTKMAAVEHWVGLLSMLEAGARVHDVAGGVVARRAGVVARDGISQRSKLEQ